MFQFLSIAVFAISVNSAFSIAFAPHITGGEIVGKIEEAPYVASLHLNKKLHCGAVIIHEYFVLTAAACLLETDEPTLYTIRAGALSHNYGGSIHYVERLISHKNFAFNKRQVPFNDIALIKVFTPFIFDGTRDAIPIYSKRVVEGGNVGRIFGWGTIQSVVPNQLRKGGVRIVNTRRCNELYEGDLPYGQICAKSESKVPCRFDGGGPLVVGSHLVGIISWGKNCELNEYPHVYTDINYYLDWIDSYVNWS